MGVLAGLTVAAVATLAGCYAPSVRDCTVSCTSPGDCASGQVCGADGMCAAPDLAGRCSALDAGHDASPGDAGTSADARPDAAAAVALEVLVTGKGSVVVDGVGVCSSKDPQRGDCTYAVAPGIALTAHAVPIQVDEPFATWASACAGQGARCVFTPIGATSIEARFGHAGIHGGAAPRP